jgi:hypothetical protein
MKAIKRQTKFAVDTVTRTPLLKPPKKAETTSFTSKESDKVNPTMRPMPWGEPGGQSDWEGDTLVQ